MMHILTLLVISGFVASASGLCATSSSWQRTRVMMYKPVVNNFYMFFRGGIGGGTIPITPITDNAPAGNDAYNAWVQGDCTFDWYGPQSGQGVYGVYGAQAKGTPTYWTSTEFYTAEFLMDCSQTYYGEGWFVVQGIWNNVGGPTWEVTAVQKDQANVPGHHWAKCGQDNHFRWGEDWCSISTSTSAPPTTPAAPSQFQCGDGANPGGQSRYDGSVVNGNDIAIVVLSSPVAFNSSIRPVCIPSIRVAAGENCYISGWGHTASGGTASEVLLEVDVPTISDSQCENYYSAALIIQNEMVCAGNPTSTDTCQGDSGGPLVCANQEPDKYYLHGITSWGIGCASGYPGVYAEVANYCSWLKSEIFRLSSLSDSTTYDMC